MSVYDHLEFRHLKYIIAVAEAGSFTAAAAIVNVVQSAISTQIRALEDILEIQIFDRDHGMALTAEGMVLLNYAQEILPSREQIILTLRAIRLGTLMPLRFGFSPFVQKSLLSSVTETYKRLLPTCELLLEGEDTDELVRHVREDSLDAAIVTLPVGDHDLQVKVLEREPLKICMRNDDPLAERDAIPASALNGKLGIFAYQRHHPTAYAHLVGMLGEVGITPRPSKPTMNIEHIQWLVKEGVCYALLRANRPLLNGLVNRPIAGVDWTIDSALISKKGNPHPALPLLVKELEKSFRLPAEWKEAGADLSDRVRKSAKGIVSSGSRQNQLPLFKVKK